MFNAPKFSKHIKAKDPDDFRGTYGKVRGLRGRGFFGKPNAHEPSKSAPDFLSYLVLMMSIYCGVGFVALHLDVLHESQFFRGLFAVMIPVFILANLIFLITESLGGRELRFRKAFVMGTWGAMTLSLIIGVIVGLLAK